MAHYNIVLLTYLLTYDPESSRTDTYTRPPSWTLDTLMGTSFYRKTTETMEGQYKGGLFKPGDLVRGSYAYLDSWKKIPGVF